MFFTGLKISHKSQFRKDWKFIEDWCLDLGAGNVLKMNQNDMEVKEKAGVSLPFLSKSELKKQHAKYKKERKIRALRYSPIVQRYLDLKEYKTKNFMKPNKMKLNPYDESQDQYEIKYKGYAEIIQKSKDLASQFDRLIKDNKLNSELRKELYQIKMETTNHQRRLEKRKNEELEKGAHEYANYLVSMLNAGTKNYLVDS